MKNKTKILIAFAYFIFVNEGMAQINKVHPKADFSGVELYGKVEGKHYAADSILVSFWKDFIYNHTGSTSYVLYPDKSGNFDVKLPAISKPGVIQVSYINEKAQNYWGNYYVEAGDKIFIGIKNNANGESAIRFSGRGGENLACSQLLEIAKDDLRNKRIAAAKAGLENIEHVEYLYKLFSEGRAKMNEILFSYKTRLSPEIFKILEADAESYISANWRVQLYYGFYQYATNDTLKNSAIKALGDYKFPDLKIEDEIAAISWWYQINALEQIRIDLAFLRGGDGRAMTLQDYINTIIIRYSGAIRDKLLTQCLMDAGYRANSNQSFPEEYEYCLQQAAAIVENAAYKRIILDRYNKIKKGAAVFDFCLPDTTGRQICLHDYLGKVILLDVWGTGCTGCADFARKYKEEISPKFKGNPDLVKISICIDNKRRNWLKGIYSGLYTDPETVNVYTEGKGMANAFVQNYDIQAIPFILLIDKKGKIVSSYLTGGTEAPVIQNLIEGALAE